MSRVFLGLSGVLCLAIALILCMAGPGKGRRSMKEEVHAMFRSELKARGVAFSGPDKEGLYKLQLEKGIVTVCLENAARDYARDGDPKAIARFVDATLATFAVPGWARAKPLLFFSAEPSDHQFGDTVRWQVSDSVCRVLVLTDLQERTVTWVTRKMLDEWRVNEADATAAAAANMDRLLEGREPELGREIDGMRLGMVPVESVFKASVIFAPGFKSYVSKKMAWPVLVVIPCRDFVYILSEKDKALLDRMGSVVQREYRESGYPITTEVLRISDEGIKAIGEFPK